MTTEEILLDMTSRDTHLVWKSSCEIVDLGQEKEAILSLLPYLNEIETQTKGLAMGGALASNQRFVNAALQTLRFHRDSNDCPCTLFGIHECMDPNKQAAKGYVKINTVVKLEGNWVDYYEAECTRCKQKFKILEREGHYMWWAWERVS